MSKANIKKTTGLNKAAFILICILTSFSFLNINLVAHTRPLKASNASAAKVANLLENAQKSFENKDYLYSTEQYKQALALDDSNPGVHFGLGANYLATKEYMMAAEYLNRAIELNPALVEAYFSLALAYQGLNQESNAIKVYRQGLGLDLNKALPRMSYSNQVTISSSDEPSSKPKENKESFQKTKDAVSNDNSSLEIIASPEEPEITEQVDSEQARIQENSNQENTGNIFAEEAQKVTQSSKEEKIAQQIVELNSELQKTPEDIRIKNQLALLYTRLRMYDNAYSLVNEIKLSSEYLAEELTQEIGKIKSKNQAIDQREKEKQEFAAKEQRQKELSQEQMTSTITATSSSKPPNPNAKNKKPTFKRQTVKKEKPKEKAIRKSPYQKKKRR